MYLQRTYSREVEKSKDKLTAYPPVINRKPSSNKPAYLHIHADIEATNFGVRDLMNGDVGHAWVSLQWKDTEPMSSKVATQHPAHAAFLTGRKSKGKQADPMGFWPYMFSSYDPILDQWRSAQDRVGYSTNPFSSYVKGQVVHPDTLHSPKATQSYEITEDEAMKVMNYGESKKTAKYSVYWFNCTTFAKEAVEAAGKAPPASTTMGIAYPNKLYDNILSNNKKGTGSGGSTPKKN